MSEHLNAVGQPVGEPVPDWTPRPAPARVCLEGVRCRLEPLDALRHADDLFASYATAPDGRDWTYLPTERFDRAEDYREWALGAAAGDDPLHYAVIDRSTGRAVGTLSLMRQNPADGVIEVGYVVFSPLMQGTPLSTEAQYLLMSYAFDELGYRRYEWKCDDRNEPSRRAAERLGFTFEGIFRQALVYKGRNRDTAWFSVLDRDWPLLRKAFRAWLAEDNFDADGRQQRSLSALRAALRD
ncbi:GNAT family N-acetyltransferase [Streptomyces sp. NBC_00239]|uniref:GNAT family N-acetyltransferase n=1 Tax=Streptomyces sp. NBC_00239 TaxID=2903640 RepID=UPI002E28F127|nr:GNAT family protein [Streptomyces sp. NBC_00239]